VKPPPPPSPAELQEKVYALYKKDRGVTAAPRFDMVVDLAADKTVERLFLADRDLVLFGKGFKGGTGYSYLTLAQFASGSDITEVTARDLTADGKAEIIVKGVMHANAPKEAGGGQVDREVVLVFQVVGDQLKRVFAAEIARAMGKKRIQSTFQIIPGGRGMEIDIGPGRAWEWSARTYPFAPESGPVGGFEPLVLPWGGQGSVRYRWNGSAFAR
jgi:hypothetical protein